jgi:hypothetical protein
MRDLGQCLELQPDMVAESHDCRGPRVSPLHPESLVRIGESNPQIFRSPKRRRE